MIQWHGAWSCSRHRRRDRRRARRRAAARSRRCRPERSCWRRIAGQSMRSGTGSGSTGRWATSTRSRPPPWTRSSARARASSGTLPAKDATDLELAARRGSRSRASPDPDDRSSRRTARPSARRAVAARVRRVLGHRARRGRRACDGQRRPAASGCWSVVLGELVSLLPLHGPAIGVVDRRSRLSAAWRDARSRLEPRHLECLRRARGARLARARCPAGGAPGRTQA